LVWHARWGGRGEPCMAESGDGGSRRRAAAAEEAGVEAVAKETSVGVERRHREQRRGDRRGLRVLG
jgi:hypothetical protein